MPPTDGQPSCAAGPTRRRSAGFGTQKAPEPNIATRSCRRVSARGICVGHASACALGAGWRWHTCGMEYRHTQWGKIGIPMFVLFAVILVPMIAADDETSTAFTVAIVVFMAVLFGVVVLFSRLEVTVSAGRVVAAFGFGRPRKVIELRGVAAVRQVRNPLWYGFGIRKAPGGWMYNVWGLDAIEVAVSTGEVFRIGTDDPANLFAALSLRITH